MSRPHRRELSIVRLTQPLPPLPLPLDEIPTPPPKESQLPPYRDVDEAQAQASSSLPETQPPGYEPMYDYLRSHQQQQARVAHHSQPPNYESSSSSHPIQIQPPAYPPPPNTPQYAASPPTHSQIHSPTILVQPYRDEPFLITIDPPPPSYNDVYQEHQEHMQRLIREFDENGTPAERSEEIFKWFISMLIIGLTVTAVGTAFNWGKCDSPGFC